MSDDRERRVITGKYRFALRGSFWKEPLIVLQREARFEKYEYNWSSGRSSWNIQNTWWENVRLEHLTEMSLEKLTSPTQPGEYPICFKPKWSIFGWRMVLMVCDGAYSHNAWRPARVQDLVLKDGQIQGGLGLMRRAA